MPINFGDPHASFRFAVFIDGIPSAVFTECTLPDVSWKADEVQEGGLNTYVHQLPGRRQVAKVTLKNGVSLDGLIEWYMQCMMEVFGPRFRKNVTITLFNSMHIPVMVWNIENAFPLKWTGPQLKTGENAVAVQTLELACSAVTVVG
jgi:phage tail-like protein